MSSHNNAVPGQADDDGEAEHYPLYILLPEDNPSNMVSVPLTDVLRFESMNDNICFIQFIHPDTGRYKGQEYACPFGRIEEKILRHPLFSRVHKQHIINFSQVLHQDFKISSIELKNHHRVPLSRRYKKAYLARIKSFCIMLNTG